MSITGLLLVSTTVGSAEAAKQLAKQVVKQRLAACAQVLSPIQSIYWWDGQLEELEESEEWLVLLKTTEAAWSKLEKALTEAHPYDVPQLIAVPIEAVHLPYKHWLNEQLSKG